MANHKAAACAAQNPTHPDATPSPDGLSLAARLAVAHLNLRELDQGLSALAAVEQLLRVPVPDDAPNDNGSLRHVWRPNLCALLSVVCQHLEDKAEYARSLNGLGYRHLTGNTLPEEA